MTNDSFEKLDDSLMKNLKNIRDRKIPESILNGFDKSVQSRILESKGHGSILEARQTVFALVFLALVISGAVWFLNRPSATMPSAAKIVTRSVSESHDLDINSDIAALKAMGEWTEDDEISAGIVAENAFAEYDLDVDDDGMMFGRNMTISIR